MGGLLRGMAEAGVPWHLVAVCSVGGVCMWGGYYSPPPPCPTMTSGWFLNSVFTSKRAMEPAVGPCAQ